MALSSLPLPLLEHIIAYAAQDGSGDPRHHMERVPVAALQTFALVARDWNVTAREIFARNTLRTLTVTFERANRHELTAFKRSAVLRGRFVRELKLAMGSFSPHKDFFMLNPGLHLVNDVPIPWRDVFRRMPNLERLDLSLMPLSSPHLVEIVDAASTYCMNMQALILPGQEREEMQLGEDVERLFQKVYEALEVWFTKGGRGGLRQLTLPSRPSDIECNEYFANVFQWCPQIEYLNGYKHSLNELDRLTCRDEWIISTELWEMFNKTCTQLKEFNWVVVPFKDDFFRVFGAHPKPQLTHLTFSVNMLWSWPTYFLHHHRDISGGGRRSPYGINAMDAKAALSACPALTNLEVCMYHPLDESFLDSPMAMYEEDGYTFLVEDYPDVEPFNQEIFGDLFWQAASENCPLLERVCMWEVAERYNSNRIPIQSFTDRSLGAIGKLTWLRYLELRSVNVTGNGLFKLLNNFPTEFGGQRDLQIALGGATSKSKLKFYNEVLKLLTRIASSEIPPPLANCRIVLRVMNACAAPVDHGWSKQYLDKLERTVDEIKAKYPSIMLRIGMTGRKFGGFSGIFEFGIYTTLATPSPWYGWEDEFGLHPETANSTFFYRDFTPMVHDGHSDFAIDNIPLDYELDTDYMEHGYGYDSDYVFDDYHGIYDMDSDNGDDYYGSYDYDYY
uniref:Uncharacterized protein n=1 Tax=Globisporangium ultimum (strain ATCC 200006 / CBS 805.95 / DAOM BR144) TaxID=431595 RepID=K3WMG6_GLOUD